jgi:Na+/melibiose symporter-like transporter
MWLIYNSFVPLWLQAGNPGFQMPEGMVLKGFGYGAFVTGIILTVDNIASLFISPMVGMMSDGTRTRYGRRKPWIMFATPLAVIAFVLIPVFAGRIPADLSGQTSALTPYFIPFFLVLVFMLLPLAIIQVPSLTIVFDISPSRHRSAVNAIACTVGGITSVIGAIMMGILFDINPIMPFLVGALLTVLIIILAGIFIKEPPRPFGENEGESSDLSVFKLGRVFKTISTLPKESIKSLVLLLLSVILSYSAFSQLQSFLSSYNVSFLGMDPGAAGMVFAVAGGAFILGTFPGGLLPKYLKRKPTYLIGLVGYAVICISIYLFSNQTLIWILVGLGGFLWAFCNVNMDVMVYDSAPSDKLLGTYGGLLQFAKTLGFILGPVVGGFAVEVFGNNYRNIWLTMLLFLVIAIVVLLPVTKGEVREEETQVEQTV